MLLLLLSIFIPSVMKSLSSSASRDSRDWYYDKPCVLSNQDYWFVPKKPLDIIRGWIKVQLLHMLHTEDGITINWSKDYEIIQIEYNDFVY